MPFLTALTTHTGPHWHGQPARSCNTTSPALPTAADDDARPSDSAWAADIPCAISECRVSKALDFEMPHIAWYHKRCLLEALQAERESCLSMPATPYATAITDLQKTSIMQHIILCCDLQVLPPWSPHGTEPLQCTAAASDPASAPTATSAPSAAPAPAPAPAPGAITATTVSSGICADSAPGAGIKSSLPQPPGADIVALPAVGQPAPSGSAYPCHSLAVVSHRFAAFASTVRSPLQKCP